MAKLRFDSRSLWFQVLPVTGIIKWRSVRAGDHFSGQLRGQGLLGSLSKVEGQSLAPKTQDLEPKWAGSTCLLQTPGALSQATRGGDGSQPGGGERITGKQIFSLPAPWAPGIGDN